MLFYSSAGQKSRNGFMWLKPRWQQGCIPSGRCREEIIPCLLASENAWNSLAHSPFQQWHNFDLYFHCHISLPDSNYSASPCDNTEPTQIIWGNLPISKFLIICAISLLSCKVAYSQILEVRMWMSFGAIILSTNFGEQISGTPEDPAQGRGC